MDINKNSDLIKTLLSTMMFVFGAIGSIFNFIRGHNIPLALSIFAVIIAGLIVYSEWRRMQQKSTQAPTAAQVAAAAPPGATPSIPIEPMKTAMPAAIRITDQQRGHWHWEGDRLVIRLIGPH